MGVWKQVQRRLRCLLAQLPGCCSDSRIGSIREHQECCLKQVLSVDGRLLAVRPP
jgi:hypothetical protein